MKWEKAARNRRRFPIHAYVGSNGSGKTLAAVMDSMASLRAGRRVLSTVRLTQWDPHVPCEQEDCPSPRHPEHGAAHPLWVPFTNWGQLLEADHCDVIMDEMAGIANSRSSMALPMAIDVLAQQLRHHDVIVRWTAPNWKRADLVFREVTQAVTVCSGYMREKDHGGESLWRPRRLFRWSTYDPRDLAEDGDPRQDARKLWSTWFWGPGSEVFRAYDSLDDVQLVGTVTDGGRCVVCGGRRQVPVCRCDERTRPRIVRSVAFGDSVADMQNPGGQARALPLLSAEVGRNGKHECTV